MRDVTSACFVNGGVEGGEGQGSGVGAVRGSGVSSEDESKLSTNSSNETFIVKHSPSSDPDLDDYVTLNSTLTSEAEHDVTPVAIHSKSKQNQPQTFNAIPSEFELKDPAKPFRLNGYSVHPRTSGSRVNSHYTHSLTLPRYRNPANFQQSSRYNHNKLSDDQYSRNNGNTRNSCNDEVYLRGSTGNGVALAPWKRDSKSNVHNSNSATVSKETKQNSSKQENSDMQTTHFGAESRPHLNGSHTPTFEDQYCADVRSADRKLHHKLYASHARLSKRSNDVMNMSRDSLPAANALNQSYDSYFFTNDFGRPSTNGMTSANVSSSGTSSVRTGARLSRSRPVQMGAYNVRREGEGSRRFQSILRLWSSLVYKPKNK